MVVENMKEIGVEGFTKFQESSYHNMIHVDMHAKYIYSKIVWLNCSTRCIDIKESNYCEVITKWIWQENPQNVLKNDVPKN